MVSLIELCLAQRAQDTARQKRSPSSLRTSLGAHILLKVACYGSDGSRSTRSRDAESSSFAFSLQPMNRLVKLRIASASPAEIKPTLIMKPLRIQLKRAYASPSAEDGIRILVDRLWPRGLTKSKAAIDRWLKDVAPSTELRKWFGHDPSRWEEFCRRYEAELSQKSELLSELRTIARKSPLTLLFAARDELHNEAVVLRDFLMR
jgi:uncharacterized protein YeaO (DUF488 family)